MKGPFLIYLLLCLLGISIARAEFRTWTERATGRTIAAELQGVTDGKARLILRSRRAHDIDILTLSDEDLVYLAGQGHFDWKGYTEKKNREKLQARVNGIVLGKLLHENSFEEITPFSRPPVRPDGGFRGHPSEANS
jgi:hypothetical protein